MIPVEGNVSARDVAAIVRHAPQLLGVSDALEVRAILYQTPDGVWVPFRRAVRVGISGKRGPEIIPAGGLRLISFRVEASVITGILDFREHVWAVAQMLGPNNIRDAFGGDHQSLRREWSTPELPPAWRVDLGSTSPSYGPPPYGPFPNPDSDFFAENASEAAATWFGVPGYLTQPNPTLEVSVAIYDRRAYFTSITREEDALVIDLERTISDPLDIRLRMVDYSGASHDQWIRNAGATVRIPYSEPFRALSACLFSPNGVLLDRCDETETSRSARAEQIFGGARREREEVADILRRGEGDTIEVKEWMPVDPSDKKAIELLQTVCAFGNTRGGVIVIGVNRQLGVVGVHNEIQKLAKNSNSAIDARTYYARRLQQRLSDGIYPNVSAAIDWVNFGGHDLCRIRIARSVPGTRHRLLVNRLAYVRLGANSVPSTD